MIVMFYAVLVKFANLFAKFPARLVLPRVLRLRDYGI